MGSEPSYTVRRGSDLLWILDFFVLRNSGREVLKLVSPLRGFLRTSKPSGAWRRPKGWQCLQPSPASAQTTVLKLLKNSFSHPLHSAPNPTWCFPEGATNLEHPMGMVSGPGH